MSTPTQNASFRLCAFRLRRLVVILTLLIGLIATSTKLLVRSNAASELPASTDDHLAGPGWWPTKSNVPVKNYVGNATCAQCHVKEASNQMLSAMANASFRGVEAGKSGLPPSGVGVSGTYQYEFIAKNAGYDLQVRSGSDAASARILWTFGVGHHGQTYLLDNRGLLYEGQISSFDSGRSLGFTPGHKPAMEGAAIEEALGNKLSTRDASRCFSCHTTASASDGKLDLAMAVPGVHCEACHGPGSEHVTSATSGQFLKASKAIFDPGTLSPTNSIDFCGACHSTTMDVVLNGKPSGFSSVRFQPYRLQKSSCWIKTQDERLTCVSCHSPHEPLIHDAAAYDKKCLACHATSGTSDHSSQKGSITKTASVCPRATSNCTSCHMPKYKLPEMHSDFTDHFIRVVRTDQPFPN